jgi:glycosyltransferase involved in cell wall biosynthesis
MLGEVAKHGIPLDRIHVLPPFVVWPTPRNRERAETHRFVYAGALTRGKGLSVLLDAMARLGDEFTLDVYGRGPQGDALRAKCTELGLGSRVRFAGNVARDEVLEAIATAAGVVVPSIAPETFGLVGAEALATEVPVIATAVGGATEWLEDGVTGCAVQPGDPAALADAMQFVVIEADAAHAMARRGRKKLLSLCDEGTFSLQALQILAPVVWSAA